MNSLSQIDVTAGGGGTPSWEGPAQLRRVVHIIYLHENPVGKGSTAFAVYLAGKQLNRAIEDSVVVGFQNPFFAVVDQPHHASVFNGRAESVDGVAAVASTIIFAP
jgi:hypothetical protein